MVEIQFNGGHRQEGFVEAHVGAAGRAEHSAAGNKKERVEGERGAHMRDVSWEWTAEGGMGHTQRGRAETIGAGGALQAASWESCRLGGGGGGSCCTHEQGWPGRARGAKISREGGCASAYRPGKQHWGL